MFIWWLGRYARHAEYFLAGTGNDGLRIITEEIITEYFFF